MITYTIKITELQPAPSPEELPVVCLENVGAQPDNPTAGEISMANQFAFGLEQIMKWIEAGMAQDGFAQSVFGQGDAGTKAIEAVKAGFVKGNPPPSNSSN